MYMTNIYLPLLSIKYVKKWVKSIAWIIPSNLVGIDNICFKIEKIAIKNPLQKINIIQIRLGVRRASI